MKHRNSHFAVGYWSLIRHGRKSPDQSDIDPKALKRASHRVSDAVYEKILGVRGAFATRIAYVAVDGPVTKRSYRLVVSDADGDNEAPKPSVRIHILP